MAAAPGAAVAFKQQHVAEPEPKDTAAGDTTSGLLIPAAAAAGWVGTRVGDVFMVPSGGRQGAGAPRH